MTGKGGKSLYKMNRTETHLSLPLLSLQVLVLLMVTALQVPSLPTVNTKSLYLINDPSIFSFYSSLHPNIWVLSFSLLFLRFSLQNALSSCPSHQSPHNIPCHQPLPILGPSLNPLHFTHLIWNQLLQFYPDFLLSWHKRQKPTLESTNFWTDFPLGISLLSTVVVQHAPSALQ